MFLVIVYNIPVIVYNIHVNNKPENNLEDTATEQVAVVPLRLKVKCQLYYWQQRTNLLTLWPPQNRGRADIIITVIS